MTIMKTGGFGQVLQYRVVCPDGKVRNTCWLAQAPDTFFSHPAAIRVRGKYVRGFVTRTEHGYEFREYTKEREEFLADRAATSDDMGAPQT